MANALQRFVSSKYCVRVVRVVAYAYTLPLDHLVFTRQARSTALGVAPEKQEHRKL